MNCINALKTILFFLLSIITLSVTGQQESQYTQFMNNKLYYNPGFAGATESTSFTALYRRQWIGFDGAPESKLLSANIPLIGDRVGLGLLASVHELGVTRNWYLNMSYSYNIKIDERSSLRIGVHGTMRRLILDFSKQDLVIRERTDESILQGNRSGDYYGNFGFGLYYQYDKFYAGFSIPNAIENNIDLADGIDLDKFAKESRHYYFMTGMTFTATHKIDIQPNLLFKYVKNAPFDVEVNFSVIYDQRITGGLSYRAGGDNSGGESIDLLVAYKIQQFTLGVSYDFGISEIGKETSGSFEIMGRFDLPKKMKYQNEKKIKTRI